MAKQAGNAGSTQVQTVEADEFAAGLRGGEFREVDGGGDGGEADGETEDEAGGDEDFGVLCELGDERAGDEDDGAADASEALAGEAAVPGVRRRRRRRRYRGSA